MRIDAGTQTAIGSRHQANEDAVGADEALRLWLIADGMGGHAAGDQASSIARDVTLTGVRQGQNLPRAIDAAHAAIVQAASSDSERQGMGSTVVAAQLTGDTVRIAWVGDSRAYLLRQGRLACVTRDHSMVQWLLDRGEISPAEAGQHPDRHVLVQTLGFEQPTVDEQVLDLEDGDQLLLCSDGVSGELGESEMRRLLQHSDSAQAAADALIAAVTAKPGKDDASVVVIRAGAEAKLSLPGWLPVALGIGAGVAIYLIWNWVRTS
jgi:protein phosphatase